MTRGRKALRRLDEERLDHSQYANVVSICGVGTTDMVLDFILREPEFTTRVVRLHLPIPTVMGLASDLQDALERIVKPEMEESATLN